MEFFRKYQRVILYTAGIFALVTFSITGALMSTINELFGRTAPLPTMVVDGQVVQVTDEDARVGRLLALADAGLGTAVMPPIDVRESDRAQTFAALRRLAIRYGIEPSADEVDRAIAHALAVTQALDPGVTDATELARRLQFGSLSVYEQALAEALRIGTFLRVHGFVADTLDHAAMAELLDDPQNEKLTLQVAMLDEEALEEQLEEQGVSDEELQAWVEGLDTQKREELGYLAPDRMVLEVAALALDAFDPAGFEEALQDVTIADAEVDQFYEAHRDRWFKEPAPGGDARDGEEKKDGSGQDGSGREPAKDGEQPAKDGEQAAKDGEPERAGGAEDQNREAGDVDASETGTDPQDPESGAAEQPQDTETPDTETPDAEEPQDRYLPLDDALRARITRRLQAQAVVKKLWQTIRERQEAFVTEQREALTTAEQELEQARARHAELQTKVDDGTATAEEQAERDALATTIETKEAAVETAREALEARRGEFDLQAAWQELTEGRPGFTFTTTGEPRTVGELETLSDLGGWQESWAAATLTEGQLSTDVQSTESHVFVFRVAERLERPLKPFAEIADKARDDYFRETADELATERLEAFEKELDELAKAHVPEKVAEIETRRDTRVEERFTEWRTDLEKQIAEAEEVLAGISDTESRRYKGTAGRLEGLREELAKADERREAIRTELQAETDEELEKLLKEQHAAVLAEAATRHGLEVLTVGPYPRNLSSRGGPMARFEKPVAYLFGSAQLNELEKGDVTELLEDYTGRAHYMAAVLEVEPPTPADITRRMLLQKREELRGRRMAAISQSFTLDALEKRYGYRLPQEQDAEPQ